jgi:hypothetical protein
VQKLLRERGGHGVAEQPVLPSSLSSSPSFATAEVNLADQVHKQASGVDVFRLIELRNRLADALED